MSGAMILPWFLRTVTVLLVAATLLPLVRSSAWWVRVFDFPRAQMMVLSLIVLGTWVSAGQVENIGGQVAVGLLLLCTIYHAFRIWPYTSIAPYQVLPADRPATRSKFRILVSNVLMENRDASRVLTVIRDVEPDLLLTVEADDWWEQRFRVLEEDYPFRVKYPLDNTYGMLLFARLPLVEPEVRFLTEEGVPSIFSEVRLPDGELVNLICVHPRPPRPDKQQDTNQRDAELLTVGRMLQTEKAPTVVAGDLNDVAWSHTTRLFQRLSGLLDPRRGRGLFSTFHADYPWLRYPLDHVFHSSHFRLVHIERLPNVGSDHFPVLLELSFEPEYQEEQPGKPTKDGDVAEAQERIQAGSDRIEQE